MKFNQVNWKVAHSWLRQKQMLLVEVYKKNDLEKVRHIQISILINGTSAKEKIFVYFFAERMSELCEGKLSRTVLRGVWFVRACSIPPNRLIIP